MTIAKVTIVIAALLLLAVFLLIRADKRKRVVTEEPSWKCAEVVGMGDANCDWKSKPRSARISKMHEPWGM